MMRCSSEIHITGVSEFSFANLTTHYPRLGDGEVPEQEAKAVGGGPWRGAQEAEPGAGPDWRGRGHRRDSAIGGRGEATPGAHGGGT